MLSSAAYLPVAFSLTAVAVWGASDFLGGVGARRANVFLFTSIVHLSGMVLAGALALAIGSPFPSTNSLRWALCAGAVGGSALAIFYRSLAQGQMGLIAPVAAVLSAAIPALVTAFSEGLPHRRQLLGFLLAGVGVWLISRTEQTSGASDGKTRQSESRPKGLGMAVLAGCGFAGFYLCIHRAGDGSALWLSICSRLASFIVTIVVVIFGRQFRTVSRSIVGIAVAAGILDISGSVVFVRASQLGRLDSAVFLSSLYPVVTVILARVFLHEHFSRSRTVGMFAALAAVPLIAG